ncbi:U32 family peptidase [Candidatus Woesearchaeota archaeon]|nr:U32 family peptidase [Candidatus Woesearchaeota archaeon]
MIKNELVAPAGNWEMLAAAVNAGADAVYFGVKGFNMRASANNFSFNEIGKVVNIAHKNNVKAYLALNIIIFEDEIKKVEKILEKAKNAGVDAVIAWDMGVIKIALDKKIKVHLSTQASASNSESLQVYEKLGIKRAVLARECKLADIKKIKKNSGLDIEVFAHGAMCVSESGRCFISEFQYGRSANRGDCLQPCRRKYLIKDAETGDELGIDGRYVMSPKDLCTIHFIDKLIDAGVNAFKIEGRARSPEYVDKVIRVYKEAIGLALQKKLTLVKKKQFTEKLKDVFNRDFSDGFYFARPIKEFWNNFGGKSKYKKQFLGIVLNYYPKAKTFYGKLNTGSIKIGDTLFILGKTTGVLELKVDYLRNEDGNEIKIVKKGETFTCRIDKKARENDKLYKKVKS